MNVNIWARHAVKRQPMVTDYAGLSYEQASRKSQALCAEAGRTGMTIHVPAHLVKFHEIMGRLRDAAA